MSLLTGKRVLLVEDEAVIAFALEDMLDELGCVVIGPAYQLDSACTLAEAEAIDVAILDVNLNEARSYAVAEILQRRMIPFLFATGYAETGIEWNDPDVTVIAKPYRKDEIAKALAALLT